MDYAEPDRVLHCWEGGPDTEDGCSTVCLLPAGHQGPHEFVRGDEVRITFDGDHRASGHRVQ